MKDVARENFSSSIPTAGTAKKLKKQFELISKEVLTNPAIEEYRFEIVD